MQSDLFAAAVYPDHPGYKARDTAQGAAEAIAPKASTLRQQVLMAMGRKPTRAPDPSQSMPLLGGRLMRGVG